MTIDEFMKNYSVDFSYNRIKADDISKIEQKLDVVIGPQLREYLLQYGYLSYRFAELFGVNTVQNMKSDMIEETLFLHKQFKKTKGLIAIEDQGDGDYYVVDSNDNVYRFVAGNNDLTAQNIKLFDYIIDRFVSISK